MHPAEWLYRTGANGAHSADPRAASSAPAQSIDQIVLGSPPVRPAGLEVVMLRPARVRASTERAVRMRWIRSLVVVVATLLAVGGCSAAANTHKTFHLDKTCVKDVGCTIVRSDLDAIPVGTLITYSLIGDGSTLQKNATFTTKDGSASGFCDFNHDGKPLAAQCTFLSGTGALTGFHLVADVTLTGEQGSPDAVWHWDGSYWFGE